RGRRRSERWCSRAGRAVGPSSPLDASARRSCWRACSRSWSRTIPKTSGRSGKPSSGRSVPTTPHGPGPRDVPPKPIPGEPTSTVSRPSSPRLPMAPELHDGRRVWRAPGTGLRRLGPRADPDWLLTLPECRIIKRQRKVIVGRIARDGEVLYIKRYNVFAWRIAVGSLVGRSPAVRAWYAGADLVACGIGVPPLVAAVEERRFGLLRRSFLLTREVTAARRADEAWHLLRALPDGPGPRAARRAFARELGRLVQRLHAARVYHPDLKDYNLLVRERDGHRAWVLLDLEGVRFGRVSPRRRVKNLMQLDRTIGRLASATDRLRTLAAYLAADGVSTAAARRQWVERVRRATARKERG